MPVIIPAPNPTFGPPNSPAITTAIKLKLINIWSSSTERTSISSKMTPLTNIKPKCELITPNKPNNKECISVVFKSFSRYNNVLKLGIRVNTNAIMSNKPILSNNMNVNSFIFLGSQHRSLSELSYKKHQSQMMYY